MINYSINLRFKNQNKKHKKKFLILGISFNVLLLGYFKYTDFFLDNFNGIFGTNIPLPHIVLPLAISFYTFQQIAFLVDSYEGNCKDYNLLSYMLFNTFFPQLIAGPIVHHKEMMPQFNSKKNLFINYSNISKGLVIFSLGLFKKVVIADTFAVWANTGYETATSSLSFFEAWSTSLSYTFQLYFDFSGYTDMAIGAALLFNIKLPINFNSPYKALNIQDFWRRWHMTLSRFLRDYIYIPLGGNRKGEMRTYINLFLVFLIGGLWHGASWMFVAWGTMHGFAIVIHRIWSKFNFTINKVIAWFITFNFINITWIFFRAENIDSAKNVLKGMFNISNFSIPINVLDKISMWLNFPFHKYIPYNFQNSNVSLFFIFFAFILVLVFKNTSHVYRESLINIKLAIFASIVFAISIIKSIYSSSEVFLYFNF